MSQTTLYTLEVTLTDGHMTGEFLRANPVVCRTIEIRADQTLNQLQQILLDAFDGREASRLSEFNLGAGVTDKAGDRYVLPFVFAQPLESDDHPPAGSMTQARLGGLGLRVGQVFWFRYDCDDDWQHRITVLAIGATEPKVVYPRVVARVGESPPQHPSLDDDSSPLMDLAEAESGRIRFIDGGVVEWTQRDLTAEAAGLHRDAATTQSYRVRTLREGPDGTAVMTTYTVPGTWLAVWLFELHSRRDDEAETILSVRMV